MFQCEPEPFFIKFEPPEDYEPPTPGVEIFENNFSDGNNFCEEKPEIAFFEEDDKKAVLEDSKGTSIDFQADPLSDTIWIKPEPRSDPEDCIEMGCDSKEMKQTVNFSKNFVRKVLDDAAIKKMLSSPLKMYICHHCGHSTPNLEKLRIHIEFRHIQNNSLPRCRASRSKESPPLKRTRSYKCRLCKERFLRRNLLRGHHNEQHRGEAAYGCSECPYNGLTLADLRSHELFRHSNDRPVQCGYCDFRTATSGAATQHIKREHPGLPAKVVKQQKHAINDVPPSAIVPGQDPNKPFKCAECEFSARYRSVLVDHVNTKHSASKEYSCDYCPFKTARKLQLRDHVIGKHTDERAYRCSICLVGFTHKKSLTKHYLAKHADASAKFTCQLCGFSVGYKDNLRRHVRAVHCREKQHVCEYCSFATSHSGNLKRHVLLKHSVERPFFCNTCSFYTTSHEALTTHLASKHSDDRDLKHCEHCGYTTNRSSQMKKHIASKHSTEKKFHCDKCDYKCAVRHSLTLHERNKHSGLSFPCAFCSFTALNEQQLKYHVSRCHAADPMKCEICDFSAPNKRTLNQHVSFNHRCTWCPFVAANSVVLMSHVESMHGLTVYYLKCRYCDFQSRSEQKLTHHMNSTHQQLVYCCDKCNYIGYDRNELDFHYSTMHSENFKMLNHVFCGFCNYVTTRSDFLLEHVRLIHPSPVSCDLCGFSCENDAVLSVHKVREHSNAQFPLAGCAPSRPPIALN